MNDSVYAVLIFLLSIFGVAASAMGLQKYTDKTSVAYKFLLFTTIIFSILTGGLLLYGGYKMSQVKTVTAQIPANSVQGVANVKPS